VAAVVAGHEDEPAGGQVAPDRERVPLVEAAGVAVDPDDRQPARRGRARAADLLNTRPLAEVLVASGRS
jgi:hypothetical protein